MDRYIKFKSNFSYSGSSFSACLLLLFTLLACFVNLFFVNFAPDRDVKGELFV